MAGTEVCAAVATVTAVLLFAIDDELSDAEHSSAPRRNIHRAPFSFEIHCQGLTDSFFERVYQMPKHTFFRLVQLILVFETSPSQALHHILLFSR